MKRWPLGVALLVLVAVGSMAWASAEAPASAKASTRTSAGKPETAEIAALYALSQRLSAQTDRISEGLVQMRVNASAGDPDRR